MGLLKEFGMSRCKRVDSPIDPNSKFRSNEGEQFPDLVDKEEWLAN